jgi:peptidoglycan/xylan/chitin deacetylase (PgdA/CDA1 family)
MVGGVGAILTLHHVRPPRNDAFQPNRLLEVTPRFFEGLLRRLRRKRIDVVSLDEMHRRLVEREFRRRFVCITFDDGYKDLKEWAYPLLKNYELPFALYIPTSFPDRLGELWWLALEAVIAQNKRIGMLINGEQRFFECGKVWEKRHLYAEIYGYLRSMKTEDELRGGVRDLCARHGVDTGPREFRIAADLGFKTAVTTRPGVLFRKHRDYLTALPRLSVNGEFQRQRYVKVLMSGAATAMWNGFRRVNAA